VSAHHQSLDSSLSKLADFVRFDASGQRSSDSNKTYGRDDTEFVSHQTYGNSGSVVSNGPLLTCRNRDELLAHSVSIRRSDRTVCHLGTNLASVPDTDANQRHEQ
jgi:hypothetical protein